MRYQDCDFYRADFVDFEGCPGLDYQGDDDQCDDCPYRLENIKKLMATCGGKNFFMKVADLS